MSLALIAGLGLGSILSGLARAGEPIVPATKKKGSVPAIDEPITPKTEQKGSVPAIDPGPYPYVCRGPFLLRVGRHAEVLPPKPGAKAAGEHGYWLAPGECAFRDRPLRDDEPTKVAFTFSDSTHFTAALMMPALAQCALDENCVLRTRVRLDQPLAMWRHQLGETITIAKYNAY